MENNEQISSSELEQIMSGARKMEADAKKRGRDDLAEKARNVVEHLTPSESAPEKA